MTVISKKSIFETVTTEEDLRQRSFSKIYLKHSFQKFKPKTFTKSLWTATSYHES